VIARSLADLLAERTDSGRPYLEFIRSEAMSVGLYVLGIREEDRQQLHTEDEVYVVIAGRSRFSAGDETREVGPGDTLYVEAGIPHRFHDITEELQVIVVFAPPERSRGEE
jgi:mannose-6-phosphate isomerase-like protein (cupin superfamily)